MKEKGKKHNSDESTRYAPMFLPMGIAMGTAIGVSTGNLALWLCLGVSFGLCIGNGLDAQQRKKDLPPIDEKEGDTNVYEQNDGNT